MTAPKIVVEGATCALTHRCLLRKFFLTPLTPVFHEGLLYTLGLALERTGVLLHHAVFMPNHLHLVVTPTEQNLSVFKRLFYGESAKFIKAALAEHGVEPPERIFAEGKGHQMRLVNKAAQLVYLHYQDVNTISAGLVERVEQYPGFSSDLGLMAGATVPVKRPPFYFDKSQPEQSEVAFCAPPMLERAYGSARDVIYQLRRARTDKERTLAAQRTRPVVGALAVTKQHPWSEPRSPRRVDPKGAPSFMVVDDEELRIKCAKETTDFRARHEVARQARLLDDPGEPPALFPYGTYTMRVLHRAPVESVSATQNRSINAPGSLEPLMSREGRRKLNRTLRRRAAAVTEEEFDDSLAQRLEEAGEYTIDRRLAPTARAPVPPAATSEAGVANGTGKLSKLVVTRSGSATERRRRKQVRRARTVEHPHSAENPKPDPPPH